MTDATDELFALVPQEFVAARDALVKRLRAEGRRAEAKEVKALRRPAVSTWALNQLAREQPDQVAALITAGEQLPAAQQALLDGDADRFREALGRHRELLGALATAGADLVVERDVSSSDHHQDIGTDLRAASTIPAARQPFREGRLTERPGAMGEPDTGLLDPGPGSDSRPATPPAGHTSGAAPEAEATAAQRRAEARRAHAEQRRRLVERTDQARRRADEAEASRDRAAAEVARLEAELEQARQARAAAERDLTTAQDRVADLEAELARCDADAR